MKMKYEKKMKKRKGIANLKKKISFISSLFLSHLSSIMVISLNITARILLIMAIMTIKIKTILVTMITLIINRKTEKNKQNNFFYISDLYAGS